MAKAPLSTSVDEEKKQELKDIAYEKRTSVSALVRPKIDEILREEQE